MSLQVVEDLGGGTVDVNPTAVQTATSEFAIVVNQGVPSILNALETLKTNLAKVWKGGPAVSAINDICKVHDAIRGFIPGLTATVQAGHEAAKFYDSRNHEFDGGTGLTGTTQYVTITQGVELGTYTDNVAFYHVDKNDLEAAVAELKRVNGLVTGFREGLEGSATRLFNAWKAGKGRAEYLTKVKNFIQEIQTYEEGSMVNNLKNLEAKRDSALEQVA